MFSPVISGDYSFLIYHRTQVGHSPGLTSKGIFMNKTELIAALADETNLPKAAVLVALDGLAAVADRELSENNGFTIPGIGKLETSSKPARTGRNPRTGATIEIPAKTAIKFKPAKSLKDALN